MESFKFIAENWSDTALQYGFAAILVSFLLMILCHFVRYRFQVSGNEKNEVIAPISGALAAIFAAASTVGILVPLGIRGLAFIPIIPPFMCFLFSLFAAVSLATNMESKAYRYFAVLYYLCFAIFIFLILIS